MSIVMNTAITDVRIPSNGTGHDHSGGDTASHQSHNWRSRFWDNESHISMQFSTTEDLDSAIDWMWDTPEMRELPRVHVGENTIIVPCQAVAAFQKAGFQFIVEQVISTSDHTPETANRIRRTG